MRIKGVLLAGLIYLTGVIVTGCGGGSGGGSSIVPPVAGTTGSITVSVDFSGASTSARAIPEGTQTVFVSITGTGLETALSDTLTPAEPSKTFADVPVGSKIVRADAFDGPPTTGTTSFGNLLGSGFTDVTVVKDQTATAEITVGSAVSDTREFTGTADVNGITVTLLQSSSSGIEQLFSEDAQGLKLHGSRNAPSALVLSGKKSGQGLLGVRQASGNEVIFEPPVLIPDGLSVSETSTSTSSVFIDGLPVGKTKVRVKYEGIEGVKVPAGEYSGPRISLQYESSGPAVSSDRSSPTDILGIRQQNFWFASGVGVVMGKVEFVTPTRLPELSLLAGGSTVKAGGSQNRSAPDFQASTYFPMTIGDVFDYSILNAF